MEEPYVTQSPVNVVKEQLNCRCGKQMVSTGAFLTSIPPQYPHKCENGHMTEVPHPPFAYPRIHYIEQYTQQEPFCTCPDGPKLGMREDWVKPRCGRCYLFVKE